jgi:hypothetical protein
VCESTLTAKIKVVIKANNEIITKYGISWVAFQDFLETETVKTTCIKVLSYLKKNVCKKKKKRKKEKKS